MDPSLVIVGAAREPPRPAFLDQLQLVPAKRLAELRCRDRGLRQEWSDRGPDLGADVSQWSGWSILRGVRETTGAGALASQLLQRTTPRKVHIRQMNVLHTAHG